MRAYEFITNQQGRKAATAEGETDGSFQRIIAAKKRTLADIRKSIDMDKIQRDRQNIGKKLADILARHRKESIRLAKYK